MPPGQWSGSPNSGTLNGRWLHVRSSDKENRMKDVLRSMILLAVGGGDEDDGGEPNPPTGDSDDGRDYSN